MASQIILNQNETSTDNPEVALRNAQELFLQLCDTEDELDPAQMSDAYSALSVAAQEREEYQSQWRR